MKKFYQIVFGFVICMVGLNPAHGVECVATGCTGNEHVLQNTEFARCSETSQSCYGGQYRIDSCASCDPGRKLSPRTVTLDGLCANTVVTYFICETDSGGGGDVDPEIPITPVDPETFCLPGYYEKAGSCEECPPPGTSAAHSTSITDCYIPSGSTFSNDTGSGKYQGNCGYVNLIGL